MKSVCDLFLNKSEPIFYDGLFNKKFVGGYNRGYN